jgi:hypothetical protein
MSGRVTKSRSKRFSASVRRSSERDSTAERESLLGFILLNNGLAEMPCTYCFRHKIECRMSTAGRTEKCVECVRRGRVCDGVKVASSCGFFLARPVTLQLTFFSEQVGRATEEARSGGGGGE